jgi:hypothetical protein
MIKTATVETKGVSQKVKANMLYKNGCGTALKDDRMGEISR